MSDEAGCKTVSKPCGQEAEEYWGIENLAKGLVTFPLLYNISVSYFRGLEYLKHDVLPTTIWCCYLSFRINILNSNLEGVVLDNRYYAGSCLPDYIQDVRFRKPYNLQQYTHQVKPAANHTYE